MVVCENTFPYKVPRARPTSAWVNPSLIRRCLNCLAKDSRSSEKQESARYYYAIIIFVKNDSSNSNNNKTKKFSSFFLINCSQKKKTTCIKNVLISNLYRDKNKNLFLMVIINARLFLIEGIPKIEIDISVLVATCNNSDCCNFICSCTISAYLL